MKTILAKLSAEQVGEKPPPPKAYAPPRASNCGHKTGENACTV